MSSPDEEPFIGGLRQAIPDERLTTPLSEPVAALCRRIVDRIPDRTIPRSVEIETGRETHWKLRALCERPENPEDEGPYGYRWPASQLTDEDMRRLAIIGNMTKIPCTKLLHLAVAVLFDQTRTLMTELLHVHEKTGQPLGKSLDQQFPAEHLKVGVAAGVSFSDRKLRKLGRGGGFVGRWRERVAQGSWRFRCSIGSRRLFSTTSAQTLSRTWQQAT